MLLTSRSRLLLSTLLVGASLLVATLATGQELGRQLHEYFQAPMSYAELRRAPSGAQDTSGRALPPPQEPSRTPGDPPPLTLSTSEDEPILSKEGPKSSRALEAPQGDLDPLSAENTLDPLTDRVDQLNYFSSFDPSVIPYKRGVAQNSVTYRGGQFFFSVAQGRLTRLSTGPSSPQASEDTFWGTHLLQAEPGVKLPIPSVGPKQRVLAVRSEPDVPVELFVDEAGNHMLETAYDGLLRVNIKVAVPSAYFVANFPEVAWRELDTSEVIDLPREAERQASRVYDALGFDPRSTSPRQLLYELIEHFRGFEGKPLDASTLSGDDLYYVIATSKVGVCRHRSFAFVLTASAAGIPVRYVYNEAHAFVEVKWPRIGWRRVDLGGAAQDVMQHSSQGHQRVHDPGTPDTLPQPDAFMTELERLAAQQEARRAQQDQAAGDNGGFESGDGPASEQQGDQEADDEALHNTGDVFDDSRGDDPSGGEFVDDFRQEEARQDTTLYLSDVPELLRRGQAFSLRGRILSTSAGQVPDFEGEEVRVVLATPGAQSFARAKTIATLTVDEQGRYADSVEIPRDLPMGRWSLRVVYDGDDTYAPAQSD